MVFLLYFSKAGLTYFLTTYVLSMFLITSAWKGALLAQLTVTKFPERVHTFEGLQANEPYKVSEFILFW